MGMRVEDTCRCWNTAVDTPWPAALGVDSKGVSAAI